LVLTGMNNPKTIHDFGGFPQELFDQQYPAPGAPVAAQEISRAIAQPPVGVDTDKWGLDHGAWSVLKPMFPKADIRVVQLSMDYARPPAEHYALGQQLKGLRERGVLIVGSGNIVHNLRATRRGTPANQATTGPSNSTARSPARWKRAISQGWRISRSWFRGPAGPSHL
jgi:4,5-DOPA dioxygenase extradiol